VAKLPVEVVDCAVHEAADGRKYWVAHGDEHDNSSINHKSFTIAGHKIFATLAAIESRLRRAIHLRNHDAATKYFVSTFYQIIHPKIIYQRKLVQEAKLRGLDGVICGHFHQPDLRQFGCITYANCGDWMQNFSALAEDYSGRLHLLKRNAGYRTSTDPNSVDKRARV
jgi:UDP-2,3-diacylglucosamine pyrophosphatase LpxH